MKQRFIKYFAAFLTIAILSSLVAVAEDSTSLNLAEYDVMEVSIAADAEEQPGDMSNVSLAQMNGTAEGSAEDPAPKLSKQDAVPETLELGVKQTYTLNTKKLGKKLTFKSKNKKIAKVSKKGVITALKVGKTEVIVLSKKKEVAKCQVCVVAAPKKISFEVKSVVLGVKESVTVKPVITEDSLATFTWSTKSKKVATVSKAGKITGKKVGKTTITVKTQNGKKAKLTVTVKKAPGKVTLDTQAAEIETGGKLQLKAKLPQKTASRITWQSSKDKVAAVDENGLVTAVGVGQAKIIARTFNKKKAECVVTVVSPATPEPTVTPTPKPTAAPSAQPTTGPSAQPTTGPDPVITNPDARRLADALGVTDVELSEMTRLSIEELNRMSKAEIGTLRFSTNNIVWKPNEQYDGVIVFGCLQQKRSLTLQATYYGLPVVEIGNGAFHGDDKLEEIVIPSTVTRIGNWAFHNCVRLRCMK